MFPHHGEALSIQEQGKPGRRAQTKPPRREVRGRLQSSVGRVSRRSIRVLHSRFYQYPWLGNKQQRCTCAAHSSVSPKAQLEHSQVDEYDPTPLCDSNIREPIFTADLSCFEKRFRSLGTSTTMTGRHSGFRLSRFVDPRWGERTKCGSPSCTSTGCKLEEWLGALRTHRGQIHYTGHDVSAYFRCVPIVLSFVVSDVPRNVHRTHRISKAFQHHRWNGWMHPLKIQNNADKRPRLSRAKYEQPDGQVGVVLAIYESPHALSPPFPLRLRSPPSGHGSRPVPVVFLDGW